VATHGSFSAAADPSPAEEAEEDSALPSKKRKPQAPKHKPHHQDAPCDSLRPYTASDNHCVA